jgi:hypothetical protein
MRKKIGIISIILTFIACFIIYAQGTTNKANAWRVISSGTNTVWMEMLNLEILNQCAAVFAESDATVRNHHDRVVQALKFWPEGQNGMSYINNVSKWYFMPSVMANADVAYLIATGNTGDDAVAPAISTIVSNFFSVPVAR